MTTLNTNGAMAMDLDLIEGSNSASLSFHTTGSAEEFSKGTNFVDWLKAGGGTHFDRAEGLCHPSGQQCYIAPMKPIEISDILALSVQDRLKLVGEIWDSIAAVPEAVELTESQRAELDRRLDSYEANPTAGSPWADVKARILKGR